VCVVPGEASQILPCDGQSCTLIPRANFTVGCKTMGGFVSGGVGTGGALPVCSSKGPVTQFLQCPPGTSCTLYPGFADWCAASGGFVDGFVNSVVPECAVDQVVSTFRPCNGSTTGCTFSGTEFKATCLGLKGMITAEIDGLPQCQVVGAVSIIEPCPGGGSSCTFSSSNFALSCGKLSGFVMKNGGANLPQCAFRDRQKDMQQKILISLAR